MEEQQNFLEENELLFDRASTGQRFADYVIDIIVYYIILFAAVYASLGYMSADDAILIYVFVFGVLLGYFTIMEGATGGKTIGKYITGTRAVKEDGSRITFGDAFMRSLCRMVPFEPFSAFGGIPWHDRWTKTMVIKENRSRLS